MLTGVAGSMAYMAPEVLVKKGYTYTIDWWSLGVCAFELLFGRRPFRGKTNSDLTYSITRDPLTFPENAEARCSVDGMRALSGLLERDITRRLGCKPKGDRFEDLKEHPWFRSIHWDTLDDKTTVSPFIPDSKKANFDATHELEELLLEDNPLKARKRNPNQDLSNLSAELRQMEEQFTPYDFKKMKRRSYYPHNQQIISTLTATSSVGAIPSSRTGTPTIGMDSMPGARADYNETNSVPPPPIPTTKMMPMEKSEAIAL